MTEQTFQEKELQAFEEYFSPKLAKLYRVGDNMLDRKLNQWIKEHDARLLEEVKKCIPKTEEYPTCDVFVNPDDYQEEYMRVEGWNGCGEELMKIFEKKLGTLYHTR